MALMQLCHYQPNISKISRSTPSAITTTKPVLKLQMAITTKISTSLSYKHQKILSATNAEDFFCFPPELTIQYLDFVLFLCYIILQEKRLWKISTGRRCPSEKAECAYKRCCSPQEQWCQGQRYQKHWQCNPKKYKNGKIQIGTSSWYFAIAYKDTQCKRHWVFLFPSTRQCNTRTKEKESTFSIRANVFSFIK